MGPAWNTDGNAETIDGDGDTGMTTSMVNKVSRHRSHWERQKSPPGFWRSDFPNTQEVAEDKRQAAERMKQEARNRYAEIMKGGGRKRSRYMFRDVELREKVFRLFD